MLLCSPSKDVLCDMEERFWNSIHRLKNAFSCGRVLPGAGAIEIACIRRLNELAGWKCGYQNTAVKRLSMREKLQEHRTAFVLGKYQISVA